jgi:hypothetical protein
MAGLVRTMTERWKGKANHGNLIKEWSPDRALGSCRDRDCLFGGINARIRARLVPAACFLRV